MSLFAEAKQPATELGRYRILSKTSGLRVSPLQLGAMSIGEAWKDFMGTMDKEQSFKLLDAFFEVSSPEPPSPSFPTPPLPLSELFDTNDSTGRRQLH